MPLQPNPCLPGHTHNPKAVPNAVPVAGLGQADDAGRRIASLYAYLDGTTLPTAVTLNRLLHELGAPEPVWQRLATTRDAIDTDRRLRGGPHRAAGRHGQHVPHGWPVPRPGLHGPRHHCGHREPPTRADGRTTR
jgi:hypothetical protein